MKKRCIFHVPWQLEIENKVASEIRPKRILQALKNIGYKVDVIWGNALARKKSVKRIKKRIHAGIKYDFLYSESSTLPTLLTEKHHLPFHPFLDFSFFKFVNNYNIPIGLYLRDIFWCFPKIRKFNFLKRNYTRLFHLYDIYNYNKILKTLFLPNKALNKYIPFLSDQFDIDTLLPGTENVKINRDKNNNNMFIYVGCIKPPIYDISLLLKAFKEQNRSTLILNCRQKESYLLYTYYKDYFNNNIKVYHFNADELNKIYSKSTFGFIHFFPTKYIKYAMPLKLFEYISYELPICSLSDSSVAYFVKRNKIGFNLKYNLKSLVSFLESPPSGNGLEQIKLNLKKCKSRNLWEVRAHKIANSLKI